MKVKENKLYTISVLAWFGRKSSRKISVSLHHLTVNNPTNL